MIKNMKFNSATKHTVLHIHLGIIKTVFNSFRKHATVDISPKLIVFSETDQGDS